jgi:hypothetical protein
MYHISNNPILPNEIGIQKGVYILCATRGGQAVKIERLLGSDDSGILYIGQTSKQSLSDRVEMFKRVMNPNLNSTAHSGALNIKLYSKLREFVSDLDLLFEVRVSDEPKVLEASILHDYLSQFGELPPLNSSK